MVYRPPASVLRDPYQMLPQLERLVQSSLEQRRRGLAPALYASGVVYRKEPPGSEDWLTAMETYRAGWGDCEDLAVWLAADYRLRGIPARAVIKLVAPGRMHALVITGTGSNRKLRDPSRALGMNKRATS